MRFFFPSFSGTAHRGFTLIEVLVALSIIITVAFAPISIVSQYTSDNALSDEHVQAGFLAQEVIEFVRCSRDSSLLKTGAGNLDWFSDLYSGYSGTAPSAGDADCFGIDYRACTSEFGDPPGTYCSVTLGSDGHVSGVGSTSLTVGNTVGTCDGGSPKANQDFTVTLRIIVPQQRAATVRYAIIEPCVSWSDLNGSVEQIDLQETIFEWVVRD